MLVQVLGTRVSAAREWAGSDEDARPPSSRNKSGHHLNLWGRRIVLLVGASAFFFWRWGDLARPTDVGDLAREQGTEERNDF
jgi:hypothetical protein